MPIMIELSKTMAEWAKTLNVNADLFLAGAPYPQILVYQELAHNQKGLGQQKLDWWNTAISANATRAEAAIVVAQLMLEGGRDPSKDAKGGAANYSDINLNRDLPTQFGSVSPQDLASLNANTADGRRKTVLAALKAMRDPRMGVERYLHHVRAGTTGYNQPEKRISRNPRVLDDDTRRFGRNIANAARKLLADFNKDPHLIGGDMRYAGNIPWI